MSTVDTEVLDAFLSLGVDQQKAEKAAAALHHRDNEVASIKSDLKLIKWMMGLVIAMILAVFLKLYAGA